MSKIISIGSACVDVFFPTNEGEVSETPQDLMSQKKIFFELGAKYKIEDRFESVGGCAANVASGLARLGVNVKCYSKIGSDESAKWIKSELEKNGVETDLVLSEEGYRSDLSAIVVDSNSGDRIIFSNQKANGSLEIFPRKIENADWYFLGDLHGNWETHLDEIIKVAEKNNIKVAFNPRQSNIHDNVEKILDIIPKSDVLFLNKDESIEILIGNNTAAPQEQMNDEKYLIKSLKELGPKTVVLTNGKDGAWGCDSQELIYVAAGGMNPIDTTGAGDSFSSGFLAAFIKGKKLEECLRWGAANAGNIVGSYGGTKGLLSEEEIKEKSKTLKVNHLK